MSIWVYIASLFLARCFEIGDFPLGTSVAVIPGASSALACQGLCAAESLCAFFEFRTSTGACRLLSASEFLNPTEGFISGPASC